MSSKISKLTRAELDAAYHAARIRREEASEANRNLTDATDYQIAASSRRLEMARRDESRASAALGLTAADEVMTAEA